METNSIIGFAAGAGCVALIAGLAGVPSKTKNTSTPQTHAPVATTVASTQPAKPMVVAQPTPEPEVFSYQGLDPNGELIEALPTDVEEFFEDYLEHDYNEDLISLGAALFHDTRLSADNSLSCAGCHDLRYGGIDRAVSATGIRGQVGPINTPTVFNASLSLAQFWDGRAPDLEAQADGPPNASGEMGSNWPEIIGKLERDETVMEMLAKAYPGVDFSDGIPDSTFLRSAIADFERTLITPNSAFDLYLTGDDSKISEEAKEGYQVFKDVGCIECHNGIGVGGKSYQRLGRKRKYFTSHSTNVDLGRFNVTGDDEDRNKFKVSSLRNITVTGPYFHDGSQATLRQAVESMGKFQLDLDLTEGQVDRLLAFLDSLTGEYMGQNLNDIQNTIGENR